jgi:small subunit ribosomal protein S6
MNNYDGMYILNLAGKEDGLKEAIDALEKEITALGGRVNGTQKMDKRKFERVSGPIDSGFYVNVQFALGTDKLELLRSKLSLNPLVYRQMYLKRGRVEDAASAPQRKTASKAKAKAVA